MKFHNTKIIKDGRKWDSKHEYEVYLILKSREKAGEITDLQMQVPFELIPVQREPSTTGPRGAVRPGKLLERPITYVADFTFYEGSTLVVVDAKSEITKTPEYIIKRKLMLYINHIRIREV